MAKKKSQPKKKKATKVPAKAKAKSKTKKSPSKQISSVFIEAQGLVRESRSGSKLQITVFSSANAALAAGYEAGLVDSVFKTGGCTGSCMRGEQRDPKTGRLKKVWCVDVGCSTGSSCRCHLIRGYKEDGQWKEDDMGEHDKDDAIIPDGTSIYFCRCT